MVKVKQSIVLLLLSSAYAGLASAMTNIDQTTIDQAQANIVEACPVRWENHASELTLPSLASEVIWADEADRTAFINYMTGVLQEMGSTASPADFADDVNSVAAECATHRTALLDLLLVKEPNDVVVGMRAMKHNLDTMVLSGRDGSTRELAARDCKTIKATFPESVDGTYWIDVTAGNSNDAVEVFCDMTFDGGGWTFVAFTANKLLNNPVEGLKFFETAVGSYQPSRVVTPDHYSLGILPELDDTEMIVIGQNPDITSALSNNRFVQFRYSAHAPMFNFGPIPCTPSSFEFKTGLTAGQFNQGKSSSATLCNDLWWGTQGMTPINSDVYVLTMYSAYGYLRMHPWLHNQAIQNTTNNWFYVR